MNFLEEGMYDMNCIMTQIKKD